MEIELGIAFLFVVVGAGFVLLNLTVGKFLRPDNPYPDKTEIYECGERPIGGAWIQFNPRFYLVALTFLVFDVEIAFVFPIASIFKDAIARGVGLDVFRALFIFMAVLLLGLAYVWVKGDLHWVKRLDPPRS